MRGHPQAQEETDLKWHNSVLRSCRRTVSARSNDWHSASLAILTFVFCALSDWPNVGYAIGLRHPVAGLTWFYLTDNRDRFVGAQALVLGAFIVGYTERFDADEPCS